MSSRTRILLCALALISAAASLLPSRAAAQTYSDLQYFTVPGCVAVDTRAAVGPFGPSETPTYSVTGSSSFAGQGGNASGCGVPTFSSTVAQVQAVNLNVIVIGSSASGFLEIYAADKTTSVSLLNFPAGGAIATSTNVVVPVNQTSGTAGDIKVFYGSGGGAHVVVSLAGYYARPQQTVFVHSVPNDPTASGTALLNAFSSLAALTGTIAPSSTRQYVVKLDPGIYDVGSTSVPLISYVDLVGSGQEATIVRGTGYATGLLAATLNALVKTSIELRDLQVQANVTSGGDDAIGVLASGTPMSLRNVTVVTTHNGSGTAEGVRVVGANAALDQVTIKLSGSTTAAMYGLVMEGAAASSPTVRRTTINVSGPSSTQASGIFLDEWSSPSVRDTEVQVSGGNQAIGYFAAYFTGGSGTNLTLSAFDSTFQASGATSNYGLLVGSTSDNYVFDGVKLVASTGTSYGLSWNGGGLNLYNFNRCEVTGGTGAVNTPNDSFSGGASKLSGGVAAAVQKCSASYNGSYTALSATCL